MQDKATFLKKYGGVYEHSPWIAEAAFDAGAESLEKIRTAMQTAVEAAPREKQLALIRAHPDLAVTQGLTAASTSEQAGAGLNLCTPEELAEFQRLNAEYQKKFGFPFIVAVRGLQRAEILEQFRKRIHNDTATEFATARAEIHKIAGFRLSALYSP
ncbi:MAG: 2-oxo-4-hydroxy-4-carboxy-5-ureidoimidazoline decarboxylase [Alphaproteobacteria bacterium]|nr:2-oxo-4-hydroxy-4-carboxy-5-ureidoimidazoline decarboxylase [Alphaproteobacteria bacterium]